MKKYQLIYSGSPGHLGCHINRTVAEAVFSAVIIVPGILGIVYQQVSSLCKGDNGGIALLLPLHIGGIDKTSTSIFNAVDQGSIFWMALRKLGNDTNFSLFCLFVVNDNRLAMPICPLNTRIICDRMKRAI